MVKVTDLIGYKRNVKSHPPAQIEAIKASMRKNGWTNPLLRRQDVIEAGLGAGFIRHGIIPLNYKSGKKLSPLDLHLLSAAGVSYPAGYEERVANTSGYNTLKAAIPPLVSAIGAKTILDPFCGMGYTAQAAVDFDLQFFGNELNPDRLAKTEARLLKGKKV